MKSFLLITTLIILTALILIKRPYQDPERSAKAVAMQTPLLVEAFKEKGMVFGQSVFIRIFKQEAELEVWVESPDSPDSPEISGQYKLFKSYPICAYSGDLGPKLQEGDGQSPEGFYFINDSSFNPNSTYHLSFNLGFPNALDRQLGRTGSFLMVHGNCVSIGCYAMTDDGIEEIWTIAKAALKSGQPYIRIHAFPFKMTNENMAKHQENRWINWWKDLKKGYDHFETYKRPPNAKAQNGRYIFEKT